MAAPGATGLKANAVFEGEKREKILDFLLGAQRGRCAPVRLDGERMPVAQRNSGSIVSVIILLLTVG